MMAHESGRIANIGLTNFNADSFMGSPWSEDSDCF